MTLFIITKAFNNQLASFSCLFNETDEFKQIQDADPRWRIQDGGHQYDHFNSDMKFICIILCLPKIHSENIL